MRMSKLFIVLLGICGLLLGLSLITYFIGAHNIISQPYQVDYGEGFHWAQSLDVAQGNPLYRNISTEPFVSVAYTPMFFLISGFLTKIFGSSLAVGRLVSITSLIIASVAVFGIVYQLTKSRVSALITGLLVFTIPIVRFWTILSRVDTLALMFTIVGFYFVVRYIDSRKLLWAVPFLVLAFLTKQSYIAIPTAVGIYLLVRNRKLLLQFVGLYIISLGISIGIGAFLTNGAMILDVFFRAQSAPWMPSIGYEVTKYQVSTVLPVLLLAVIYLVIKYYRKSLFDIVSLYWIIALVFSIIAASRLGAYGNSLIEWTVVTCVLAGLAFDEARRYFSGERLVKSLGALSVVVPLVLACQCIPNMLTTYSYPEGTAETYASVQPYIRNEPGPILSENAVFLLNEGRPVLWEPSMLVACRLGEKPEPIGWANGQIDFVDKLRSGHYKMVILDYKIEDYFIPGSWSYTISKTRLTDEMAGIIRDNFIEVYHSGPLSQVPQGVCVYVYGE